MSAVEAKQVAQQDSERAKYIVERAIQEKKGIVIKAAGEAKSAELIGNVQFLLLLLPPPLLLLFITNYHS